MRLPGSNTHRRNSSEQMIPADNMFHKGISLGYTRMQWDSRTLQYTELDQDNQQDRRNRLGMEEDRSHPTDSIDHKRTFRS